MNVQTLIDTARALLDADKGLLAMDASNHPVTSASLSSGALKPKRRGVGSAGTPQSEAQARLSASPAEHIVRGSRDRRRGTHSAYGTAWQKQTFS